MTSHDWATLKVEGMKENIPMPRTLWDNWLIVEQRVGERLGLDMEPTGPAYRANRKDVFEAIIGRVLIMGPAELEEEFGER